MNDFIVSAESLNFSFMEAGSKKKVLQDLNLQIKAGEIVIITGQSGSGKSTLLTLLGALRQLNHGSLLVLGQELLNASEDKRVILRRKIGFIFQAHNLLSFLTAKQNVRMALELDRTLSSRQLNHLAETMLNELGLGHKVNEYPENLSGGQKQRVAIARALVRNPQLLLADEPTASLDSKSGLEVLNSMYSLAKERNCAIVLVTHDPRILDFADRVIKMEDGRLCKCA